MTHPVKIPFATDDDHPAGGDAWSAQPNKEEPAAGRMAEGYPPETEPAAEHWNWLVNELAKLADRAAGLRLFTWFEGDFTAVDGAQWSIANAGVYNSGLQQFIGIDEEGRILYTAANSAMVWDDDTADPEDIIGWTAGNKADITVDDINFTGANGRFIAVGDGAVSQVAYKYGAGIWTAATPTISNSWSACELGQKTAAYTWVIGSTAGNIQTAISTGAWPGWTARTSNITSSIKAIATNAQAGGFHRTIAISNTELTRSNDFATWTAVVTPFSGLTSTPEDIGYSAKGDRWSVAQANGYAAYSDDNGSTWTEVIPDTITGTTLDTIKIQSDGDGHWVMAGATATKGYIWASIDNAETWHHVETPNMDNVADGTALMFGRDQFVIVGNDTAFFTPRLVTP